MKFLCDNCKAKYKIADEKIAGRTLRMKCRRCGFEIVIRGDRPGEAVQAASEPSERRDTGPALGADFRRQVAGGSDALPRPTPTPLDQWHVAIHDVPVGPVRRDELARKVGTGSVTGDSLVWREGFDDWRPLKDVAELLPLLRQGRAPMPPPPRPPSPRTSGSVARSAPGAAGRSRSGSVSLSDDRPKAHSNVIPIGGRMGGAAPAVDELALREDMPEEGATQVSEGLPFPVDDLGGTAPGPPPAGMQAPTGSAVEPSASWEYRAQRRAGIPIGAWMGIVGAGAFGIAFAAILAQKFLSTDEGAAAALEPAVPTAPAEPAEPDLEGSDLVFSEEELAGSEEGPKSAEAEGEAKEEGAGSGRRRRSGASTARASRQSEGSTSAKSRLTEEERKRLARFAEGGGGGPAGNIRVPSGRSSSGGSRGEPLNRQQLTSVVTKNRGELQRCYENAIRGMSSPPAIRMDVTLTVGTSGMVTRVRAEGNDPGGLRRCIEGTVRRWRFPTAGDATQTNFPVVFQPGA